MKKTTPYWTWFIFFSVYNLVFLSQQFAYIASDSTTFLHGVSLPFTIYYELIATLLIHILLYILLAALQTLLLLGLTLWHLSTASLRRWHISIWLLCVCTLITSNIYLFPLSRFSVLFLPILPHALVMTILLLSLLIMGMLILNLLFFIIQRYPKLITGSLLIGFGLSVTVFKAKIPDEYPSQSKNPNIILIGVDSLNPNKINAKDMPTLTDFINHGILFKETITPLARTYPSWTSILTGLYPLHHHAHYNLMPPDLVNSFKSIAWTLKHQGYQTLFATDDRRFSNMGKEFGFQTVIGPKIGANDLFMGSLNDFPLSNLLINLPLSQWLFPYNYINRASHFSYYPHSFDKALQHGLSTNNTSKPMLIAVHFTLPHWPYTWASSSPTVINDKDKHQQNESLYQLGLQQVDQQVAHFLSFLRKNGYLKNSMVILLSDHGETLALPGSRQTNATNYQGLNPSRFVDYLERKNAPAIDISEGHGSDLLSPDQYHCLLAFKIYQKSKLITPSKIINTRIALIDIAPTILNFLNLNHSNMDGVSLLDTLIGDEKPPAKRFFIMESGMLPNQIISRQKAIELGKRLFRILPSQGQLQLRKDQLPTLDAMKLYAILDGDWIVALYPDDKDYIPITQRLSNGKWTDELDSDFAKNSPAKNMLRKLHHFYNKDRPNAVFSPLSSS